MQKWQNADQDIFCDACLDPSLIGDMYMNQNTNIFILDET